MILLLLQSAEESHSIVQATWIIAGATIVYVAVSTALWLTTRKNTRLTRDIFEAAHRPYLGVANDSAPLKDPETDEPTKALGIIALITNHGTVPANEVKIKVEAIVGGLPMDVKHPDKNIVSIPPKSQIPNILSFSDQETKAITDASALTLRYKISYKGIKKQYYYDLETVYYPKRKFFAPTEIKSD